MNIEEWFELNRKTPNELKGLGWYGVPFCALKGKSICDNETHVIVAKDKVQRLNTMLSVVCPYWGDGAEADSINGAYELSKAMLSPSPNEDGET